jgi:hypothetical protein
MKKKTKKNEKEEKKNRKKKTKKKKNSSFTVDCTVQSRVSPFSFFLICLIFGGPNYSKFIS